MSSLADSRRARTVRLKRYRHTASAVLLWIVAIIFLLPVLYAVAVSLKPAADVFDIPPTLVGSSIRWQNYVEAMTYLPFGKFIANSVLVAGSGTIVVLIVSSTAAYAFARLGFRGRSVIFMIFLCTLMIPQEVLVIPLFIEMQGFGWVDSYPALILPFAFTAFGTFLLRQFFLTVPQEMDDAATIDGAGRFRTFVSIMLPLARPSLAVLAVFTFITYWNSFLWPLVITYSTYDKGVVPVGLQLFFSQQGSQWHLVMAAAVVSMVPTVIIVLLLRRHLVSGISTAGLGGR
ncbi:carbohydrate ABC transporter permease [Microlunatus soli]|uniref:Carbohydrate ABC transporter membrane protein 2, CUT1 family n=1 Tax=Microlunatus soli TaxID=630515 RepID=A0A1H1Z4U8_9ACTN|nr:carbohydrate ABC transporter permease [Microlunatus soli]SDT28744.1 carbohydrate ABC transporter membrane protein 2, CUT1 family [Microlunatus soli]